jgi:hypothetical protein
MHLQICLLCFGGIVPHRSGLVLMDGSSKDLSAYIPVGV